ncbi:MAG: hypothetical protein WC082_15360 [Victivallales bacterium]|jgi:hypothetical protein
MTTYGNNFKLVECSGTPREMGRQYGEQARNDILRNVELFAGLWNTDDRAAKAAKVKKRSGNIFTGGA